MWVLRAPWGYVLLVLGGAMLPGAIVAGVAHEWPQLWSFAGLALGATLGGWVLVRRRTPSLRPEEAPAFVAASYLLFSLAGAVPFLAAGGFLDGWFEALSGITTTGLSVFVPEELPRSLVLFRSLYQWIGGAGIVILSLALLLPPGRAAISLFAAEYGQENVFGNVRLVAQRVATAYLGLTVAGYGAYLAAGMGPFDGLVHVLSTISTGGFSPYTESIAHFRSPAVEAVVSLFMCAGATSFPLLWAAFQPRGWRKALVERELWLLLAVPLVLGGIIAAVTASPGMGLFQGISAVTTTGFATVPAGELPDPARWALVIGMVLGGMGGSTAGGIKLFRTLGLLSLVGWAVRRARLPGSAQVPFKFLGRTFSADEALGFSAYTLLYLAVLIAAALALTSMGYGLSDSLFEAASAQGTVGLSAGIARPGAPAGAKLLLMLLMWMGRLEIFPVILFLRKAVRAG
ncbi:TrkH family potassium uptake protein [Candidatus Bipolaricaulota sp. J31]